MKAIDKFDMSMEYKFSTYATDWIRRYILYAIMDKSRSVRIPVAMCVKINAYNKRKNNLKSQLHREPLISELAKELGISIDEVIKFEKISMSVLSLSYNISEDSDIEFESLIPSSEESIQDVVEKRVLQKEIIKLMYDCGLTDTEMKVLMLRNGFNNMKPLTLSEVGTICNLTHQRVRQIESRALFKIRKSKYISSFVDYMDSPDQALKTIKGYKRLVKNHRQAYLLSKKIINEELNKDLD